MFGKRDFSISTFALIQEPFQAAIDRLIDDGWTAIEIMCEDGHREILDWPEERLAALKEKGVQHGVRWSFHAPVYTVNPCATDEQEVEQSAAILHRAMDIAETLECSHVVIHAGASDDEQDGEAAVDRCAAFVSLVLEQRNISPLRLVLENVPPKPGLQGTSAEFVRAVVDRVADPRFGILLDVGHAHVRGDGYALKALELCLPHLIALHLNDNLGDFDAHLAIGMGTIPYEEIVGTLAKHQFNGTWVIETESVEYANRSVNELAELRMLTR